VLTVRGLTKSYGPRRVLDAVGFTVQPGEVLGLIGPNGAGKTTLLNSVAGLLRPAEGEIRLNGESVTGSSPDAMLRLGLALVPEHRRLFSQMSVAENLKIGGISVGARERTRLLDECVDLFPVLGRKLDTRAGFLSGGEAQQLAVARALMSNPRIVLMDEPSLGLAPVLVDLIFDLVDRLRREGKTLLVVEQNATRLLRVADRAYVLRTHEDLFDVFVGRPRDDGR
jgi:branched-chain amino acid transport system ATP-binding protein